MPCESDDESSSAQGDGTRGLYSNYFRVGHTACEVLIDFGQAYSDLEQERFYVRIITSPFYAKELLRVFQAALDEYEKQYGEINPTGD